jgi:hypothetical protein
MCWETAEGGTNLVKALPKQDVGIDSLRDRLSKLLFHHV